MKMEIKDFKHPNMENINNMSASHFEENLEDIDHITPNHSLLNNESDNGEVVDQDVDNQGSPIVFSKFSPLHSPSPMGMKTEAGNRDSEDEVIKVHEADENETPLESRDSSIIMFGGNTPSPSPNRLKNKNSPSPIRFKDRAMNEQFKNQEGSEGNEGGNIDVSPVHYRNYKHGNEENGIEDDEILSAPVTFKEIQEQQEEYHNSGEPSNRNSSATPNINGETNANEIQEEYDSESNANLEEPIYVMTIELEGRNDTVKIFANSIPDQLAYEFCKSNDLDHEAMDYLKEEIKKLMVKYLKKTSRENENHSIKELQEEEDGGESDRRGTEEEHVNQNEEEEGNIDVQDEEKNNEQDKLSGSDPDKGVDEEMITEEGEAPNNYEIPKSSRTHERENKFYSRSHDDEDNNDNVRYKDNEDKENEDRLETENNKYQSTIKSNQSHDKSHALTENDNFKKNILNKAEESLFREKNSKQKLFSYELFDDTLSKSHINNNSNVNKSNFFGNTTSNFNIKTTENQNYQNTQNTQNNNQNSQRSNKSKKPQSSIFDKLYQDAENRRKKVKNNNKDFYLEIQNYEKNKSNYTYDNTAYGEKIYERIHKQKEEKHWKLAKIKNDVEHDLDEACTFKPVIHYNKFNENFKNSKDNENRVHVLDYETQLRNRQYRLDILTKKKLAEEVEENRQVPKIDDKSRQMASKKLFTDLIRNEEPLREYGIQMESDEDKVFESKPVYEKLYQLYRHKDININRLAKQYEEKLDFKPNVNKSNHITEPFEQRLYFKIEEKKQKMEDLKEKIYNMTLEDENGQRFFYPKLISKRRDDEMLTNEEKKVMINYGKKCMHKNKTYTNFPFKPKINKNSRNIDKRKERGVYKEGNSLWNLMDTSIKSDKLGRNQNSSNYYNCISVSDNRSTIDDIQNYTFNNFLKKNKSLNLNLC